MVNNNIIPIGFVQGTTKSVFLKSNIINYLIKVVNCSVEETENKFVNEWVNNQNVLIVDDFYGKSIDDIPETTEKILADLEKLINNNEL